MAVEISIQFFNSTIFFLYETSDKVHGNFHVPCNETHGKVHENLPCDTHKQAFPHLIINSSSKS